MADSDREKTDGTSVRTGKSYKFVVRPKLGNARWLAGPDASEALGQARSGMTVCLRAEARGVAAQTAAKFEIYEADKDSADDFVAALDGTVEGGAAQAQWAYTWVDDVDEEGSGGAYTKPEYYFICRIGDLEARSGLLEFQDFVELEVLDPATKQPLGGRRYVLQLPDGTRREGVLDANGAAREENLPPGRCTVRLVPRDEDTTPAVADATARGHAAATAGNPASSSPEDAAVPSVGSAQLQDYVELEILDSVSGTAYAGKAYELVLPDGSSRRGTLDARGCAREEQVPPGRCLVKLL